VADARLHAQRLARRLAGDEVDARGREPVALQARGGADGERLAAASMSTT